MAPLRVPYEWRRAQEPRNPVPGREPSRPGSRLERDDLESLLAEPSEPKRASNQVLLSYPMMTNDMIQPNSNSYHNVVARKSFMLPSTSFSSLREGALSYWISETGLTVHSESSNRAVRKRARCRHVLTSIKPAEAQIIKCQGCPSSRGFFSLSSRPLRSPESQEHLMQNGPRACAGRITSIQWHRTLAVGINARKLHSWCTLGKAALLHVSWTRNVMVRRSRLGRERLLSSGGLMRRGRPSLGMRPRRPSSHGTPCSASFHP